MTALDTLSSKMEAERRLEALLREARNEIDMLRDAIHDALEAGEKGDWQSARRALCLVLMPNVERR